MIAVGALTSIALFVVAISFFRVIAAATAALATARQAVDAMRDAHLDDHGRERAMRQASRQLFGHFASILGRGLLALAAAALPIWALEALERGSADRVFHFLTRWDVILISTVAMMLGFAARNRLWQSN